MAQASRASKNLIYKKMGKKKNLPKKYKGMEKKSKSMMRRKKMMDYEMMD